MLAIYFTLLGPLIQSPNSVEKVKGTVFISLFLTAIWSHLAGTLPRHNYGEPGLGEIAFSGLFPVAHRARLLKNG